MCVLEVIDQPRHDAEVPLTKRNDLTARALYVIDIDHRGWPTPFRQTEPLRSRKRIGVFRTLRASIPALPRFSIELRIWVASSNTSSSSELVAAPGEDCHALVFLLLLTLEHPWFAPS